MPHKQRQKTQRNGIGNGRTPEHDAKVNPEKNRYTHCYKGFVIHYRPKTAVHPVARYEVLYGDQSFGLFDGKTQAICYIDQLYHMQRIGGVGKRMCAS